jgi:hypothetical protein
MDTKTTWRLAVPYGSLRAINLRKLRWEYIISTDKTTNSASVRLTGRYETSTPFLVGPRLRA